MDIFLSVFHYWMAMSIILIFYLSKNIDYLYLKKFIGK
jgi:hypothetical protein